MKYESKMCIALAQLGLLLILLQEWKKRIIHKFIQESEKFFSSSVHLFYQTKTPFRRTLCYLRDTMPRQCSPCFFSHTHVSCMALHHTVVIRFYRTPYQASDHLVIYRECYGFERAFFLISGVFYLALLPAVSEASLGPAVQPQSQQGFMLIFETQPRPGYLFESQQFTIKVCWQVLFKCYGWSAMKNLLPTGFELFSRQVSSLEALCFIRLATEFCRLSHFNAQMFYGVETFLQRKENLTFTDNLLLTGFELFSQQVRHVKSCIFYPFDHRVILFVINKLYCLCF